MGGIGWGLGYISPVGALMKWFPDRKGLATGLSLCFFGGGAVIATPVNEFLLSSFSKEPEKLGYAKDLLLLTDETGRRFAEIAGETIEVVEAVAANTSDTVVYAVSTGSTGVAMTFATMGLGHMAMMLAGALLVRLPNPDASLGSRSSSSDEQDQNALVGVNAKDALKMPQFYLLWTSVFGSAVAGVSVISCAKTMMNECFSSALPALVTSSFCASFVAMLSGANMTGRLGWATASDWTGRKNMYFLFGALGIPTTLAIPTLTTMASEGIGGAMPL